MVVGADVVACWNWGRWDLAVLAGNPLVEGHVEVLTTETVDLPGEVLRGVALVQGGREEAQEVRSSFYSVQVGSDQGVKVGPGLWG